MRVSAGGDVGPSEGGGAKIDAFGPWGWPLLIIGGATFFGLVASVQSYYSNISAGRPMAFWDIARYWLPDYYVWAALTPAIVRLARRFPLRGAIWKASLATHVTIAPLFAAVELLLSCIVISLIAEIPESYGGLWGYFTGVFSRNLVWGILVYAMIVAAGHAYDLYREVQRRDLQTSELEGRLARARLRALETKLRPHFLFNTLHSIGMLVRMERPADAQRMLAGLSDLLRRSLDGVDEPEVSLAEELEFLERYLELEQIRFHDRLLVAYDVDPRTLDARVPSLILQPLVESAVRYGVEPHAGPRHVRIAASLEADRIVLEVVDDGPSADQGASRDRRSRLGLAYVRERLESHYGSEASIEVRSRRQGGVTARVGLPLRPGAMPPPGREEKGVWWRRTRPTERTESRQFATRGETRSRMTKMSVLVVDDEPLAREGVRILLEADDTVAVAGEASSGGEAVEALRELQPDIVFLDVQMPEMNGFEVLEQVDLDPPPVVVFVTAYDEYAIQAFEVHAMDYLLKPFDDERFDRALQRAREQVQRREGSDLAERLGRMLTSRDGGEVGADRGGEASDGGLQRLVVRSSGRVSFVDVEKLEWVEAAGDYVRLHTETGSVLMRETMKVMEQGLDPETFVRIHRSTIVRVSRIRELRSNGNGRFHVVLRDGTERSVSTTGRDRLEDVLGCEL